MKKIFSIFTISLLVVSCGDNKAPSVEAVIESNNLNAIRSKRTEIVAQQQEIANQIKELDLAISKLDTLKKLPLVTTIVAKDSLFNHYLELQGNVDTKQNIVIVAEAPGIINRVYVKEGQRVSKGQLLASIDDGGLSQNLAQLEVQAELAKTTYDRQKRLWDQKIGSEIQYLQAKTTYEAQQNAIGQLKKQIAKTQITAPFSGVLDDVISEQGSIVSPGASVFRIVNLNNMYIQADVPESYISNVTKGKAVEVFLPILGKTIQSKVRQAGNYIHPSNRTFTVEIAVPNEKSLVKPNLTAKIKINDYTNPKAILIPQSIISENAEGVQYVYVTTGKDANKEATAKRAFVKTGKTQGDLIEILEGINNGDAIILEGARSVKDGQKVKILN
ncbi:efflux RND transporter periplasmic adaptor subunit [Aquimarina rhabdastrellae]